MKYKFTIKISFNRADENICKQLKEESQIFSISKHHWYTFSGIVSQDLSAKRELMNIATKEGIKGLITSKMKIFKSITGANCFLKWISHYI